MKGMSPLSEVPFWLNFPFGFRFPWKLFDLPFPFPLEDDFPLPLISYILPLVSYVLPLPLPFGWYGAGARRLVAVSCNNVQTRWTATLSLFTLPFPPFPFGAAVM